MPLMYISSSTEDLQQLIIPNTSLIYLLNTIISGRQLLNQNYFFLLLGNQNFSQSYTQMLSDLTGSI